jgi:hypothetical protein
MNWSINGKELRDTSDPAEIATELNLCAKEKVANETPYYLLPDNYDVPIISNVPPCIYEKEVLKKYVAPSNENVFKRFIDALQNNIDMVHYENGNYFQLNNCFYNSQGLFYLIKNLSKVGAIKPRPDIKIVLG